LKVLSSVLLLVVLVPIIIVVFALVPTILVVFVLVPTILVVMVLGPMVLHFDDILIKLARNGSEDFYFRWYRVSHAEVMFVFSNITPSVTGLFLEINCVEWERGRGDEVGRVEPEKRLEEQQFTKLSRKYQHD
jgi:hypothetical protein